MKKIRKEGKGQVVGWTLELEWSDGVVEQFADVDNQCANEIDAFLTTLEQDRNEVI